MTITVELDRAENIRVCTLFDDALRVLEVLAVAVGPRRAIDSLLAIHEAGYVLGLPVEVDRTPPSDVAEARPADLVLCVNCGADPVLCVDCGVTFDLALDAQERSCGCKEDS